MLCRSPPPSPLLQHILLLCEYSEPLGESIPRRLTWTLNYWKTTLSSHVYKGFPFINLSTTPIFAYLTYLVARCRHSASYPSHRYTKKLCRQRENVRDGQLCVMLFTSGAPPPPPPHNTINHCVSRRNHCVGQFLCNNLLEHNFQGPHVYQGFPL